MLGLGFYVSIGAWEEQGHCPCPNNEIFAKETIQNIFFESKCKISEKQLEQLANLYAYNLKKSQSLIGHFLLRLTKLVRKFILINTFMKMTEIEVAPYLHGRGFSGPTKTYHVGIIYIKLYPLTFNNRT